VDSGLEEFKRTDTNLGAEFDGKTGLEIIQAHIPNLQGQVAGKEELCSCGQRMMV
jgi:hypothetical protein